MSNLEEYFNSAVLDVITPIVSVGFPPHEDIHAANAWLEAVEDENVDRNLAFFGKVHKLVFIAGSYGHSILQAGHICEESRLV